MLGGDGNKGAHCSLVQSWWLLRVAVFVGKPPSSSASLALTHLLVSSPARQAMHVLALRTAGLESSCQQGEGEEPGHKTAANPAARSARVAGTATRRTCVHVCLPQELKKEVMEQRLVLDTVNEVSRALLELVPWRAREGLDKLVSDTNERYKLVSDTIKQRVEEIDAAIQRSQQVI